MATVDEQNNTRSVFRYKKANEILATLTDFTLTHTNKLNDFTEGSALETLYEAISTEIEMFYQLNMENIKFGVWNSIHDAFGFSRKPALKAYGQVLITYNSALQSDTVVPSGVTFTSSNPLYGQSYETLTETTISAGTQYALITVYCTQTGTYGNIPSGVIDSAGNIGAVANITNPEAFSTGQDVESLAEVRVRFRQYIQALQRGTVQAIQYGAMNMPNVAGAYIAEEVGLVRLYAHDANGDLPLYLQKAIQGEMEYWRPAGIPVQVLPTHKTVVDLDITITVPNTNLHVNEFLEAIRVKLVKYLNSFKAHDHLYKADLVQQIMDANDLGIVDTDVKIMVYPDLALRDGLADTDKDRIIVAGNYISRAKLQPKDRSVNENYIVSNPEDKDDNQYSQLENNDEQENGTRHTTLNPNPNPNDEISTTSTTSDTTYPDNGNNGEIGNGNDLIYPEELSANFKVNSSSTRETNTGYLGSGDPRVLNNFNPTIKNPIAVTETGLMNGYYLYTNDGTMSGMVYDSSSNAIELATRNTDKSFAQVVLNPSDLNSISFQYAETGSEHPENSDAEHTIQMKLGETLEVRDKDKLVDLDVTATSDLVTIKEVDSGTTTQLYRKNYRIVHLAANGATTNFTYDTVKAIFTVEFLDTTGVKTISSYNGAGILTGSVVYFTDDVGNTTAIYRDASGSTIRTVVTDRNGNVISDSSVGTDTTTDTTDTTSDTTYPEEDTTTESTTTTTTACPFVDIPTVDADDAPDDGYLPVFREYATAANEILRAGYITINFK